MHPLGTAVARQQLKSLDNTNALVAKNVQAMNRHLTQLEGIAEPALRCRPDPGLYHRNMLFMISRNWGSPGRLC
jgi:hypothetical protein